MWSPYSNTIDQRFRLQKGQQAEQNCDCMNMIFVAAILRSPFSSSFADSNVNVDKRNIVPSQEEISHSL